MEDLLTEAQKSSEKKREQSIKSILHKKKRSSRSFRIKSALSRNKHNRLTRLEVPELETEGNQLG